MLKSVALKMINDKICACEKCEELTSYRKDNNYKYVPGTGNSNAKVMFIGEAPGENEAKKGIPFCGKAGKLLTNIIEATGLSREEVFIGNTIKCRPPNNRDPESEEIENCRKFLDLQIKTIDPEWIVCLGRIASARLLSLDSDTPISSLRGKIYDYLGRKVICTFHPAYILHSSADKQKSKEAKEAMWEDLQPLILALQE
jgi:uracil-DNA glycosylase